VPGRSLALATAVLSWQSLTGHVAHAGPSGERRAGTRPTAIELCAGGGGHAIGISAAGFSHVVLVETNRNACATLKANRPEWSVWMRDLRQFDATEFKRCELTLVTGGVPCQPFTIAGHQKGRNDDRDLFPEAIRIVGECLPRAIMFENVAPLAGTRFSDYRVAILSDLRRLGYYVEWRIVNAADFGVPQDRRRFIIVGRRSGAAPFPWPRFRSKIVTVGDALRDLMAANGWRGAQRWALQANQLAPTIVGGSDRHGGADLGPTRARRAWAQMRVDGRSLADAAPSADFPENGSPRLTLRMAARLQAFPDSWNFAGSKTAAYRQIGNAFPPAVAQALALAVLKWLELPSSPSAPDLPQLRLFSSAEDLSESKC
jgi:DNA (cytosine-5)-methyltransferase 1